MSSVVVVGGGVTGLAAAWHLVTRCGVDDVIVLEGSARVGGKLAGLAIAGQSIDGGAESVLARRPEAVQLFTELEAPVVHPARLPASLWSRGALTPMPAGTLMGVPSDPEALRGLLTDDEVHRAAREQPVDSIGDDLSVGDLVERACGPAVVDRLVEPLLGGVYAGHARQLSARACVPALWAAVARGESVTAAAARAANAGASRHDEPVFASVRGGLGVLPQMLTDALRARRVQVRTGAMVSRLAQKGTGWELSVGAGTATPAHPTYRISADAVLLCVPAAPTARLLGDVAADTAKHLREVRYASMALVTYAFPAEGGEVFEGTTGFLVPPVDGRDIKASTFSSSKWPWLIDAAPGLRFVRVSFGRQGEERVLQRGDAELAALGLADLRRALGNVPEPVDTVVRRWGGGLPQYAVGHLDLVAAARAGLGLPMLRLAGAAYDGVGIPACIASGREAAAQLAAAL